MGSQRATLARAAGGESKTKWQARRKTGEEEEVLVPCRRV